MCALIGLHSDFLDFTDTCEGFFLKINRNVVAEFKCAKFLYLENEHKLLQHIRWLYKNLQRTEIQQFGGSISLGEYLGASRFAASGAEFTELNPNVYIFNINDV